MAKKEFDATSLSRKTVPLLINNTDYGQRDHGKSSAKGR